MNRSGRMELRTSVLAGALCLGLAGCGDTGAKTVTETITPAMTTSSAPPADLKPAARQKQQRAAAQGYYLMVGRLIVKKKALGFSRARLAKLVPPTKRQEIAGQVLWYYEHDGNLFQVVFSGDRVTQINRY